MIRDPTSLLVAPACADLDMGHMAVLEEVGITKHQVNVVVEVP